MRIRSGRRGKVELFVFLRSARGQRQHAVFFGGPFVPRSWRRIEAGWSGDRGEAKMAQRPNVPSVPSAAILKPIGTSLSDLMQAFDIKAKELERREAEVKEREDRMRSLDEAVTLSGGGAAGGGGATNGPIRLN